MNMKEYGKGKSPLDMKYNSPAKGLFGKIGGAIKGALTGKDGKFGLADAGRLALGPAGLIAGAARGMKMTEKASGKAPLKNYKKGYYKK